MKKGIIFTSALLLTAVLFGSNFGASDAQAKRSCRAKKAVMTQRCNKAKSRPSRTNKKACSSATNSYNRCLKG